MPVLLVRHAHALSRSHWVGDDSLRDLSERGRLQAHALIEVLSEYGPGSVLSSPYRRCLDTVAPLAAALGLEVEWSDALAEGSGVAAERLVRSVAGTDTVLCSHGDVIPEILQKLSRTDGVDLGKSPRNEKASTWVLRSRLGRFTEAAYLKPPRVD